MSALALAFALAGTVRAEEVAVAAPGSALRLDLEVAGEVRQTLPDAGLSRELRLSRAMLGLGVERVGPASARVQLQAVRSGGESGYIGIAGESIVPRFQVAEAGLDASLGGELRLVAGLVLDPWVDGAQQAWGQRSLGPVMAEEQAWMSPSDIGGTVRWVMAGRLLGAAVGLQTGEGLAARERNDGQDLVGLLELRPLAGIGSELLTVAVMGRDGSRGVALARDHRLGARIHTEHRWVQGGVEALAGWGLDGDPARVPGGLSAWVTTGDALPALAWGRLDLCRDDRKDPETGSSTWRLGGGPALGGRRHRQAIFLVLGLEGRRYGRDAAALAGAGEAAAATAFFLQVGSRLAAEGAVSVLP